MIRDKKIPGLGHLEKKEQVGLASKKKKEVPRGILRDIPLGIHTNARHKLLWW